MGQWTRVQDAIKRLPDTRGAASELAPSDVLDFTRMALDAGAQADRVRGVVAQLERAAPALIAEERATDPEWAEALGREWPRLFAGARALLAMGGGGAQGRALKKRYGRGRTRKRKGDPRRARPL